MLKAMRVASEIAMWARNMGRESARFDNFSPVFLFLPVWGHNESHYECPMF